MSEVPKVPTPAASFEQNATVLNANNIGMKGSRYLTFKPLSNLRAGVVQVSVNEIRDHCVVGYDILLNQLQVTSSML